MSGTVIMQHLHASAGTQDEWLPFKKLKKFRVCLVGVKIIFVKNDFFILRCLAKKEKENYFKGKMIFPI